jgi:hypothetical protein
MVSKMQSLVCTLEGTAKLLEAGTEQDIAFECIQSRLKASDDILEEAQREDGHQFYKVSVKNWYLFGRFGDEKGQKYQIEWNAGKS